MYPSVNHFTSECFLGMFWDGKPPRSEASRSSGAAEDWLLRAAVGGTEQVRTQQTDGYNEEDVEVSIRCHCPALRGPNTTSTLVGALISLAAPSETSLIHSPGGRWQKGLLFSRRVYGIVISYRRPCMSQHRADSQHTFQALAVGGDTG